MTIDEIILKALEGGPVTVDDIVTRFKGPVRSKLEKLRRRAVVLRDGKGGRTESSLTPCYVQIAQQKR
jgi:hypothetical protein